MEAIRAYLDGIEMQLCRDGFMTNALHRHLSYLGQISDDSETEQRIDRLIARYHRPYAHVPPLNVPAMAPPARSAMFQAMG